MEDLKGKNVLVTGGSRGIGRSIALAFAALGSRVIITGRTQSTLNTVAEEIRRLGGETVPLTCDVTRKEDVETLEHEITGRVGTVQVLINNAGIAPAVSFLEMDDRLWEEVLKVNLTGTYYCCKVFLPGMIASEWGRIINIASTVAKVAYSHISAYTASKHAVLGLTRALAVEMARSGVTVNAVCPGYVDTDLTLNNARLMAEKMGKGVEEILKFFKGTSPQNRLIAPEEVARLAVMLASDSAKGITGQAINIDGGAVMV
ncbi:MAG: SDR family oxidoreductase [Deltaproteobacteria bacterium]|nr:SDR family oxidoreductase [Deltaproteobacteria bacterium]